MKNKLWGILFLFVLLIPWYTNALVTKSDKKYVTDEANILSEETEDYIVKYSDFIYKEKKLDFYVVTVKNLEEKEIEEYADEVYETFKMRDRGLLILISKEDRKMRIQAGEKLSNLISSELIDEYIDAYFIPFLEIENWNEGVINGYNAFYKYICEQYGIDASRMKVVEELSFLMKYKTVIIFIIVWLSVMAASSIAKYITKSKKYPEKMTTIDTIKIIIIVIGNIFLLAFAYILETIYLLFVLGFEGITLYSNLSTTKEQIPKEPKEKKIEKKKVQKKENSSKKHSNKYYKDKRKQQKNQKKRK